MPKKKIYYRTQRELDGLQYIAKVLDFGETLTITSAFNEMLNAHIVLSHTPMYKHELKLALKRAESAAELHRRAIEYNMRSKKFYEDYSDAVIDSADNDITLMRISIKQTLDSTNTPHSGAIARVETAHVLLCIAKTQYDEIIKSVREKYGCDFRRDFSEYDIADVLAAWDKVCKITHSASTIDLNTSRSTALANVLCRKFMGGEYIQQSLQEAVKNDDDITNEIKIAQNGKHASRTV